MIFGPIIYCKKQVTAKFMWRSGIKTFDLKALQWCAFVIPTVSITLTMYDAKNISRAFKWPKFAEGLVLKAPSHSEL